MTKTGLRSIRPRTPECGHPDRRHYARGLCAECWRHTDARKAQRRDYYRANRHLWVELSAKQKATRSREAARYGVSQEWIARTAQAQGNKCAICASEPRSRQLAVDHDHQTGAVRALLCGACNRALGLMRDRPELLRAAASYLEFHEKTNREKSCRETPAA